MPVAPHGEVNLAYEIFGPPGGRPLLLISGLAAQMTMYPPAFCLALVEAGFQVIRFDNRDVGLSTHLDDRPAPSLVKAMLRPSARPYTLQDMAGDAVAVLDAAGWAKAHVLGTSLGGFIAQLVAIDHPDRVLSLTSLSSSPATRGALPKMSVYRTMSRIVRTPETSAEQAEDQAVEMFRLIGSPAYFDEPSVREMARLSYERSPADPEANLRQQAASLSSKDRRAALSRLRIPALVLHGDVDPMMSRWAARATAAAIPGARLVIYPGWGHDLPQQLWPSIIEEIRQVTTGSPAIKDGGRP
ncbi:MAG: alpha/beta hydrolase [Actinoplanes sp.]